MLFNIRFLKISQVLQENICVGVSFLIKSLAFDFIARDSNTGASCEICKVLKNIFCCRTPLVAASGKSI